MNRAFLVGLGFLATGIFSTSPAYADGTPPPAGLVAWWRGEGNATDAIGTNNGVEIGNVQYALGKVGMGFSLNGTNSYIRIPYSPNLSFSNALTIELWYQCAGANGGGLVNKRNDEGGPINYGTLVVPGADGLAYFNDPMVVDTDTDGDFESSDFNPIPSGTGFHHFAVTWQQVTNDLLVVQTYIDGQLVKTRPFSANLARTVCDAPVTIGVYVEYPDYGYFNGVVDEVSIYNRALASNEIAAVYNADSAGKATSTNNPILPGIVAWWPGESNLVDVIGGNNGTPVGDWKYANAEVGLGFLLDGSTSYVPLPASSSLDIGASGSGVSIECWIKPDAHNATVDYGGPLVEWDADYTDGLQFWAVGGNILFANVMDTSGTPHVLMTAGDVLTTNNWQHVALTYDKASGWMIIYVNGSMVASNNIGTVMPQTTYPEYHLNIGRRTGQEVGLDNTYSGGLDELSLYNRALTPSEIQAIYQGGTTGKSGGETSTQPLIVLQPENQTVSAGGQANFSVTVIGLAPLAYQWKRNGSAIAGATNASLALTNLHVSQSGNYSVAITNVFGAVTSSNAILTVTARDLLVYNYSGTDKVITLGQEFSYNYSGRMFFAPSGTNGVFIGWATLNGKKQYWVSPFSDYLWVTIPGSANHVYTVLGKAGNDWDDSGRPHLWSYLHRGLNAQLAIGNQKKFSFPGTFNCKDTHVYPNAQTGKMILRDATSTYLFAAPATQAANNSGKTLADLVNAVTKSLAQQGYQKQ